MPAPAAAPPRKTHVLTKTQDASEYRVRRDLIVWTLAAIAMAIQVLYITQAATEQIIGDQADYINMGRHFLDWWAAPGIDSLRMPGYSFLLSLGYGVGLENGGVRIVQAILLALCVPLVARLASRIGGAPAARTAAVLFTAYLPLLTFSSVILTEVVSIALAIAAVATAMRTAEPDNERWLGWTVLTATLLALAAIVRINSVLVAVPVVALLLCRRRTPIQMLSTVAIVAAAFCIAFGPWVARNQALNHTPSPTGTTGKYPAALGVHLPMDREVGKFSSAHRSARFWSGSRPDGFTPAVAAMQDNQKVLTDNIFHHTREFVITRVVGQFQLWAWPVTANVQYGINDVPYGPLMAFHILLILLGLLGFWRYRAHPLIRIGIAAVALTAAMQLLTFPQPRYVLPVLPLLMVGAAPLIVATGRTANRAVRRTAASRRVAA